jgi:hypothetical protein
MKNSSKRGIVLSLVIAGGLAGACEKPSALSAPPKSNPTMHILIGGGVAMPDCAGGSPPPYSIVARIKILSDKKYLFDATTQRSVTYWLTQQDTDVEDKLYANENSDTSTYVASDPYDFDLKTIANNNTYLKGKWAKIRVILDNSSKADRQVSFADNITLESDTNDKTEICSVKTSNQEYYENLDNDNKQVAAFYVFIGSDPNRDGTRHFNIGVVSKKYAPNTPIFIDPKIPNNG